MVRPKLSHIKESCIKFGFELLDEKYKNNSFKHQFKCLKHNQIHRACFKVIKLGIGLRCCRLERLKSLNDFRRHNIDDVRKNSLESGFEFLDEKYEGINHKHFFKCLRHGRVNKASYKQIKRGFGLKCCHRTANSPVKKDINEFIFKKLDLLGFKLVGDYRGLKTKCLIKCKKHGKVNAVSVDSIINKKHRLPCCYKEHVVSSASRVKDITKEMAWRHETKSKNEHMCYVCRRKNLAENECVAYRFQLEDIGEIINPCLCSDCNVQFHKIHGFVGNTHEQFKEFIESFRKYPGGAGVVMRKIEWNK